jgi:hypothetical protein
MFETIRRNWLPIVGGGSSVSFKGIQDIIHSPEAYETAKMAQSATNEIINQSAEHGVIWYLIIGAAGAAGGLLVKVLWGCTKFVFPVLKKIDPDKK